MDDVEADLSRKQLLHICLLNLWSIPDLMQKQEKGDAEDPVLCANHLVENATGR